MKCGCLKKGKTWLSGLDYKIMETKICTKCKKEFPATVEYFHRRKGIGDGLVPACKKCKGKYDKNYWKNNKNRFSDLKRNYYETNKEIITEKRKKYREFNKAKLRKQRLDYYKNNKDRINKYYINWRRNNIQRKIADNLRNRLYAAVKNKYKAGSAVSDLGISIDGFIDYFESKFKTGMMWENHGEWHIDHIRPLSSFDLTDREQFIKACHYTNLQPLWAAENIKKGSKII